MQSFAIISRISEEGGRGERAGKQGRMKAYDKYI